MSQCISSEVTANNGAINSSKSRHGTHVHQAFVARRGKTQLLGRRQFGDLLYYSDRGCRSDNSMRLAMDVCIIAIIICIMYKCIIMLLYRRPWFSPHTCLAINYVIVYSIAA